MLQSKKKFLCVGLIVLTILIMAIGLAPIYAFGETAARADFSGYFGGGDGSASNPFIISTEAHLNHIRDAKIWDEDDECYYIEHSFKIMNDIYLTNAQWLPIETYFRGTIDGNYKTIYNMKIYVLDDDYYGFIRFIEYGGLVKDLNFQNAKIESRCANNHMAIVGLVAGGSSGAIKNCEIKNSSVTVDSYASFVGGIAGSVNRGVINDCSNDANVTGTGIVGGIVGYAMNNCFITDCWNRGSVTYKYDTQNGCAGGIAGKATMYTEVNMCINYGKIVYGSPKSTSSKIKPCMAQIVGWLEDSIISDCAIKEGVTDYTNLCKIVPKQNTYCSVGEAGRITGNK